MLLPNSAQIDFYQETVGLFPGLKNQKIVLENFSIRILSIRR